MASGSAPSASASSTQSASRFARAASATAMGVVTGTFGGLIRDVVGNELPMVLRQGELYVTAAFGGAVVAVALIGVGMPRPMALIFCGLVVMALRAGSLLLGWSLPTYRARPPRADKNNR